MNTRYDIGLQGLVSRQYYQTEIYVLLLQPDFTERVDYTKLWARMSNWESSLMYGLSCHFKK